MLLRLALLVLLMVLAPPAFLCWGLPQTQGYARLWSSTFAATVFVQFFQVTPLALGAMLISYISAAHLLSLDSTVLTLLVSLAVLYLVLRIPGMLRVYALRPIAEAGLAAVLLLVAIFSVQLSGSTVGGGPCLPSSTGTAGTGGCSGNGAVVAQAALAMAPHLHGTPDAWYDAGMPQPVLRFWSQACPPGSGCWIDWQEGSLQCVLFVTRAYALSGSPLPAAGNAIDFWSLYQNRPGWVEIPSATAPPAQRGLPLPGALMVWSDPPPLVGHVAIVVGVI